MDVGHADCLVTGDIDEDVAQQVLARPTVVKVAADDLDDRRTALQMPGPQVADGVIGEDACESRSVAIVHGAGEPDQCTFNGSLFGEQTQVVSCHFVYPSFRVSDNACRSSKPKRMRELRPEQRADLGEREAGTRHRF